MKFVDFQNKKRREVYYLIAANVVLNGGSYDTKDRNHSILCEIKHVILSQIFYKQFLPKFVTMFF